ncbi:MAG: hypothetical protein U5J95_03860 [Balneolaceae bacterium]|nr:hypothetical protein [Balneolaceae bacterium]
MKSLNILIVIFFFAASSLSAQNASKKDKIKEAMSSAPASIAESATIMDFPAEEGGEMILLREGTNGYTCFPDMPATSGYDPMCLDESWMKLVAAWMNKEDEVKIDKMGFGYMLQGGAEESNVDPFATEPTDDNEWISNPVPHLMIIFPNNDVLKGLPVTPDQGGPWVMFRNTPYVHVMAPMPKNNSSGTTTQAHKNTFPEYTMEQRWQSS